MSNLSKRSHLEQEAFKLMEAKSNLDYFGNLLQDREFRKSNNPKG